MLLNINKNFFSGFQNLLNLFLTYKNRLFVLTVIPTPIQTVITNTDILDPNNNNRALVLFDQIYKDSVISDTISDSKEAFPWLYDENGIIIDYTKKLSLVDGVKITAQFLKTRYNLDKGEISDLKVSEVLQIFEKNENVTILDLYNHVSGIISSNKNFFKDLPDTLNQLSSSASNTDPLYKPLGSLGDITLNQIYTSLENLKWERVIKNTEVSIKVLPVLSTFIGYGLILRTYVKFVHNANLPENQIHRIKELKMRRRELVFFALASAPLLLGACKYLGPSFSDILSENVPIITDSGLLINNNNNIESSLLPVLGVLNSLYKKIPYVLRFFFKLTFLIIIIIKLLGVSIITFLFTTTYHRIFLITFSILIILYQLLCLFLLNKFYKKTITIPEILPSFLINWLKEFEALGSSTESFSIRKKNCYTQIGIYVVILLLSILII